MNPRISLFLGLLLSFTQVFAQGIPDKLTYCGMELTFSLGAKKKLQAYVNSIYESPRFFNTMVEKADTYMPFIEEAFRDAALPMDLKYLVIQESSLKADAVSDFRCRRLLAVQDRPGQGIWPTGQ
jgi:membrane-bound lytic murein transglycosylase D